MKRIIFSILLLRSLCLAQGARIMIVTDLEGAGGVNDAEEQLLPRATALHGVPPHTCR